MTEQTVEWIIYTLRWFFWAAIVNLVCTILHSKASKSEEAPEKERQADSRLQQLQQFENSFREITTLLGQQQLQIREIATRLQNLEKNVDDLTEIRTLLADTGVETHNNTLRIDRMQDAITKNDFQIAELRDELDDCNSDETSEELGGMRDLANHLWWRLHDQESAKEADDTPIVIGPIHCSPQLETSQYTADAEEQENRKPSCVQKKASQTTIRPTDYEWSPSDLADYFRCVEDETRALALQLDLNEKKMTRNQLWMKWKPRRKRPTQDRKLSEAEKEMNQQQLTDIFRTEIDDEWEQELCSYGKQLSRCSCCAFLLTRTSAKGHKCMKVGQMKISGNKTMHHFVVWAPHGCYIRKVAVPS